MFKRARIIEKLLYSEIYLNINIVDYNSIKKQKYFCLNTLSYLNYRFSFRLKLLGKLRAHLLNSITFVLSQEWI